jgi:Sugar (and other) transporter
MSDKITSDFFSFGYDTGQISGFLFTKNFEENIADQTESTNLRRCSLRAHCRHALGTLVATPIANTRFLGRKVLHIHLVHHPLRGDYCPDHCTLSTLVPGRSRSSNSWLEIGALSVLVPMYQGESSPTHVRGAIVCCYQFHHLRDPYCIPYQFWNQKHPEPGVVEDCNGYRFRLCIRPWIRYSLVS